jgi:Fe-S-cluster containining protein
MPSGPSSPSELVSRRAYQERLDVFLSAKSAGYRLTYESLRQGVPLRQVVSTAAEATAFADEALGIVGEEYRPPVQCKEGCAFCCRKPGVLVTIPEFVRIVEQLLATLDRRSLDQLRLRIARYVSALDGRSFNEPTNAEVPCPLLVNDRCSVYAIRPLVCRSYNSTSVEACRRASLDQTSTVPIFAMLKDVTDGITVGVAQALERRGLSRALLDLGSALAIALEREPAALSSALESGGPFAAAEHLRWSTEMWQAVCDVARQVGVAVHEPW